MENQQEQSLSILINGDEVETRLKGDIISLASALASALNNEDGAGLRAVVKLGLLLSNDGNTEQVSKLLSELDADLEKA